MIVKVKSKYGSLVAVRDKYIKKCKKEFDDLTIQVQGEEMLVPYSQLDKPIKRYSVPDKFSGNMHELFYFQWKPKDEDLASKFKMHEKTLKKNIDKLQVEFPNDESLFRYLGNKQYFYESDVNTILNLFSKLQKNKIKKKLN